MGPADSAGGAGGEVTAGAGTDSAGGGGTDNAGGGGTDSVGGGGTDSAGGGGMGGQTTAGAGSGGSAGSPGEIGAACSDDAGCANQLCVEELDGGGAPTGWSDGYCTKTCAVQGDCGPAAVCVVVGVGVNVCLASCLQTSCRQGYVCEPVEGEAICVPNCNVPGAGCVEGASCTFDGLCERCPYVEDGECDEPEGTDLCPEGADVLDCASDTPWECGDASYDVGDGCHCDCGDWDPDCDVLGAPVVGCTGDELCLNGGTCAKSPRSGKFVQLGSGANNVCGVRDDGTVTCWGSNYYGESEAPAGAFIEVSGGGLGVSNITAETCGLRNDATVLCWGDGARSAAPLDELSQVDAGGLFACGLRTDGTVVCWGNLDWGVDAIPTGSFVQLSAGGTHACALRADGSAACWGFNNRGQTQVPPGTYTRISAGYNHTCGVTTAAKVVCWGSNGDGALNVIDADYSDVAAGNAFTCGLRTDGSVACWGFDYSGQADPPSGTFTGLTAGDRHTCGLTPEGTPRCWGNLCVPGETSCVRPSNSRYLPKVRASCTLGGSWQELAACQDQACVDGACVGVCTPGATRCYASWLETCDDSGQWQPETQCPFGCGMRDGLDEPICNECQAPATRCSGIALQQCGDTGFFATLLTCPSACVDGACVQGTCDYGATRCQGNTIERCSSEGEWSYDKYCGNGCSEGSCVIPSECEDLAFCCNFISGLERVICQNVSQNGSALACSDYLEFYGC